MMMNIDRELTSKTDSLKELINSLNSLEIDYYIKIELKNLVQKALQEQVSRSIESLNLVYNQNEDTGSDVVWIEMDNTVKAISNSLLNINLNKE